MAREFKEVAHLKTNLKDYGDNWDHVFNKYKCNCHLFEECICDICQESKESNLDESDSLERTP